LLDTPRARWHPQEAQAAKEKAQEITYLIKQAKTASNYLYLASVQNLDLQD
jgi:hypothetical protein